MILSDTLKPHEMHDKSRKAHNKCGKCGISSEFVMFVIIKSEIQHIKHLVNDQHHLIIAARTNIRM